MSLIGADQASRKDEYLELLQLVKDYDENRYAKKIQNYSVYMKAFKATREEHHLDNISTPFGEMNLIV